MLSILFHILWHHTGQQTLGWSAEQIFFQRLLLTTPNNCWSGVCWCQKPLLAGVEQVLYASIQTYFIHRPSFGKESCLICIIQSVYGHTHTHQHTLYQSVFPSGAIPQPHTVICSSGEEE